MTKNDDEPEVDAVLLLERLLAPLAQRHHRRHVDFVERREHRGGALRFDEAARDRGATLRHADAFLAAVAWRRAASRRRRRGAAIGCGAGAAAGAEPARCGVAGALPCAACFDVALRHPARHAGALDAASD